MKRVVILVLFLAFAIAVVVPAQDARRVVYATTVKGMIHGGVTGQIEKSIDEATRQGGAALLIELDTPAACSTRRATSSRRS
jgi:membrane-bound ClpP family serine protease